MSLNGIIAYVSQDAKTDSFETTEMMARLRAGDVRALARDIGGSIRAMPATMRQLAVVQLLTWLGLFRSSAA